MTAQTTIEALLFELRDGLGALAEHGTSSRLMRCDQEAMRQVIDRLRRGYGHDPHWRDIDIQTLLVEWHKLKG